MFAIFRLVLLSSHDLIRRLGVGRARGVRRGPLAFFIKTALSVPNLAPLVN